MLREEIRYTFSAPHRGLGTRMRRVGVECRPAGISGWGKVLASAIQADNAMVCSANDSEFRTLPSRDGDVDEKDSRHSSKL